MAAVIGKVKVKLPKSALASLEFIYTKKIVSPSVGEYCGVNVIAGYYRVADNTEVPFNTARKPRVTYSEVARLNNGVCEKKLLLFGFTVD